MKKNIAIITGGDSSEEVISVQSARLIMDSVDQNKYQPYLVYIRAGAWYVTLSTEEKLTIDKNDFSFLQNHSKIKFDMAYLIIHGPPAENGKLQAYLDLVNVPYVGPGLLQASVTFNKEVCKQYLSVAGIKSSPAILVSGISDVKLDEIESKIGYPCFVKPNEAGSSFGVSKIYVKEQLDEALNKAFSEDSSVLIEKFVSGTEVTCGVFKLNGNIEVLPATEIVSTKDFFDYEAKYTPGASDEITPARISDSLTAKCRELTGKIYAFLDLTGFARVDYIISNDTFYLLEVNTIPGMSPGSIIPKQLKTAGKNIKEVITALIDEALSNHS